MKKTLIYGAIFTIIGTLFGQTIIKSNISKVLSVMNKEETYYFLQEGVYSSIDSLNSNTKNIKKKVIEKLDGKYYVYLGITKDQNVATKLKNIYKENGITIYQKEKNVTSEEFLNNVTQFDMLINSSQTKDEILTIEEVVLANYEEIKKNN